MCATIPRTPDFRYRKSMRDLCVWGGSSPADRPAATGRSASSCGAQTKHASERKPSFEATGG